VNQVHCTRAEEGFADKGTGSGVEVSGAVVMHPGFFISFSSGIAEAEGKREVSFAGDIAYSGITKIGEIALSILGVK
jgi:hypothetical protein